MARRIRLRTAPQVKAKRLSDHHACVVTPQEAIIIGEGSTAVPATPTLLDA